MPIIVASLAALIDRDGRVLIAKRPHGKPYAGLWEFPGGKLETGETPEAALIRELQEELGISTIQSCLAPLGFASTRQDNQQLLLLLYACRKWQGQPQAMTGEGSAIAWVRPNQLSAYTMPAPSKPLVALLQDWL
ncbi:MAG: (deoxy)nucleoside triphosphate pyrophosphohydrolase [Proteobacteria bacterium]|nr:(deoxy)nucleoside triphosphate pyrophosphohydrolase [Pseudomonadota bacterium]